MVAADLQLVNGKQRFVLKIEFAAFGMEPVINVVVTDIFQLPGISFELLVPIADPAAVSRLLVRCQMDFIPAIVFMAVMPIRMHGKQVGKHNDVRRCAQIAGLIARKLSDNVIIIFIYQLNQRLAYITAQSSIATG